MALHVLYILFSIYLTSQVYCCVVKYIERYGTSPVWSDYRRNHKGGIPPQKTHKTCIVEIWEPPSNLLRPQCHHPLSECEAAAAVYQSICRRCVLPHTDRAATLPGSSCGLLREDYSNSHDAVGSTMTPWYRWYHTIQPDETEVAKVKKTYKTYLK